jgi:hypothetical protein
MGDTAGAVKERVSGAPGGGPMLPADKLKEFASGIEGMPEEGSPPTSEPAPETPAPASEAPAAEEAAPPAPAIEEGAPPPAVKPPGQEPPKGPIPYDRFLEVNQQLQEERRKVAEYSQRRDAEITERANAQAAQLLLRIAEQNPEMAAKIYGVSGQQPPPAPEPKPDPNMTPEQKEIAILRKQQTEFGQWKQQQERAVVLNQIQTRAETQMKRHPVFENPAIRERSEEIIVKRILTEPQSQVEAIVDMVAKQFRDIEESVKAKYVVKKKEVAKSVAPGVGSGAPPAPPAHQQAKMKLGDSSLARAMAKYITAQAAAPE